MAEKQILQLPKTQFSGLEFSNILEDVYNLVKENPEYNESWDDFLSSNAGVMMTEIFAWITDQLATRIDWVVNENFIGTATQRGSIINLLKLIGYKFELPAAAEVPVEVTFGEANGIYVLTSGYDETNPDGGFNPKTLIAKDKKGNTKFFEAISYSITAEKFEYDITVEIDTDTNLVETIDFYEGQTKIETFESTTNQGQVFSISESPVIRNSIIVTLATIVDLIPEEETLLEVDSFLNLKAQQLENADGSANAIPYVVNVLEDDAVEISFGSSSLLANQDRRLTEGATIKVFYRIGGGTDGEISRHAINVTENITNNAVDTTVTYLNKTEGVGSEDSETIEHAAYSGPLQIKTAGKTVTEEDYDIILSSFVKVLLSKAYGHNNIPSDYFEKYGTYISPLEVLNFVIIKKSGWEETPTSKYKYANWGTFNLENYFNEIVTFNEGVFGTELNVNSNNKLVLSDNYDYDNQGGRIFKNYMVISTPQVWKDEIWIEDENNPGNYIANPELTASLTNTKHIDEQLLSDIGDHFVDDNDLDPFFYGDYNETGLPKPDITEDINAYFQSKKDVTLGVYIGASDHLTDPNQLELNIDGHGDVVIDLSVFGIVSGLVPLDGDVYPAAHLSIIDTINDSLAEAYNDIYSYHDFGVLIEDTTAQVSTLEDKDEDIWTLRVGDVTIDPEHYIDFDVDLGVDQSYDSLLTYMNDAFLAAGDSGYQDFNIAQANPYTVVDTTQYDFNITIDGVGPTNILLEEAAGITTNELTVTELIEMINNAFYANSIEATATDVAGEIRISSANTGATTSISIVAGTTDDLLAVTGVMETAVAGTGIAGADLVATFVTSTANIACKDVRISRTNQTGEVLLSDGGTTTDILAAYGALPLTTLPVNWGDYSTVATVVEGTGDAEGERYIKLTSPNIGPNAGIVISQHTTLTRDATAAAFGLDFALDGVTEYNCYGQRKLTIIYRDTEENDFGDFIYEHGSIHFNDFDPQNIYLNYIAAKNDTVKLGSYYTDNFEDTDPEWKLPAHRVYNTIYKLDVDDPNPEAEIIDYDVSNFIIEFTKNEINDNSIYVIAANDENTELALTTTSYPTITSIDLSAIAPLGTPDTTSPKYIKLSINENADKKIDISDLTGIAALITTLNTNWGAEANEYNNGVVIFADYDPEDANKIVLTINDKTKTGKIVIYDDEVDLLGAEIFGTTANENTTIYPSGDYYLEHYVMPADEPDTRTAEEKFGYFNMHVISGAVNSIPDLAFYAHFVNDRRHKFLDKDIYRIHTDEDDLIEVLQPYKIAGVDNSFKKPVFSTFDCRAHVYITTSSSKEQVEQAVDTALRSFYSLENTILSQNVNKSEFIGAVLDVPGVRYIDITYFGHDYSTFDVNDYTEGDYDEDQKLEIVSNFDEILVLSDDVYATSGEQTHGLIFQYSTL